jgi:hypothetical protein
MRRDEQQKQVDSILDEIEAEINKDLIRLRREFYETDDRCDQYIAAHQIRINRRLQEGC